MPDSTKPLRALIADDERMMRDQLQLRLRECWPDLEICGTAKDGLEAVRMVQELQPDVVFLDIRMPGLTGIEAAREIAAMDDWSGEIVFATAYDEYAVTAFEQGAIDYLLKPVEAQRLNLTVARIKECLSQRSPMHADGNGALMHTLKQLQRRIAGTEAAPHLRWLQCSVGNATKMIDVADVLFFRSDEKYTRVQLAQQEALIRTPIRELVTQLDDNQFWQIHRSTIVNLSAVAQIQRDEFGRQRVSLKHHPEVLEVSRSFAHLFKNQ